MDAVIKNMVLKAVYSTYISSLHNLFMGYMGPLTRDIMNHLMKSYRLITADDIKEKKNSFKNPWTLCSRLICSTMLLMMGYNMLVRQTHHYLQRKYYR